MTKKVTRGVKGTTGSVGGGPTKRVVVDELEALASEYRLTNFSEDEKAIIWSYIGRVPVKAIAKHLGCSSDKIQHFMQTDLQCNEIRKKLGGYLRVVKIPKIVGLPMNVCLTPGCKRTAYVILHNMQTGDVFKLCRTCYKAGFNNKKRLRVLATDANGEWQWRDPSDKTRYVL